MVGAVAPRLMMPITVQRAVVGEPLVVRVRATDDDLPPNAILIARNLGPADLLEYDRTKLKGLLLEEGSAASHAAIVARAKILLA